MKKTLLVLILLQIGFYTTYAQEHEIEAHATEHETELESEEEGELEHHQIGAMIGHAHIYQGSHAEGKNWLVVPMVSLNYNYWITKKWGVGLHTDFILETYEVHEEGEEGEIEILERELPIAPALMALYKPGEHFTYMLGIGEEFAKEEDLFLIRAEVEYGLELPKGFEFGAALGYDIRFDAYDSWVLAVGISKLF